MKKYLKGIKLRIENWIKLVVKEAISESKIEDRVEIVIEKLRYDYLPHGACWMCSMPISRKGGYEMWRGKMFCQHSCFEKYAQIIQKPDVDYKMLDGDPVEVFKPKSL